MAEAEDLKSSKCGFDPHSGHHLFCISIFPDSGLVRRFEYDR